MVVDFVDDAASEDFGDDMVVDVVLKERGIVYLSIF